MRTPVPPSPSTSVAATPPAHTPGKGFLDPEHSTVRVRNLRPISVRIPVDRAAKKAANLDQLYDLLAAEIPTSKDRQAFLDKRPR
jgi:hypothetical protein